MLITETCTYYPYLPFICIGIGYIVVGGCVFITDYLSP